MNPIKSSIKSFLKYFNIGITEYYELQNLRKNAAIGNDIRMIHEMLNTLPIEKTTKILQCIADSKSQLRQDIFVLSELNFKTNGFFVEFGATNGVDLSNTHLLEKKFGWIGILAEPARCWHKDLKKNRSAIIETKCVWTDSDSTLKFNEVDCAELSTINSYSDSDFHQESRKNGKTYKVKTISLNDLLVEHNAPKKIDYLSIDTEGSEFEILSNFDFSKYSFQVITCEHNFTPQREKIFNLLSKNGYMRIYQELSNFDDWYIKSIEA